MGNTDAPGIVADWDANFGGSCVRGCYVTTLRAIPPPSSLHYAQFLVMGVLRVRVSRVQGFMCKAY